MERMPLEPALVPEVVELERLQAQMEAQVERLQRLLSAFHGPDAKLDVSSRSITFEREAEQE